MPLAQGKDKVVLTMFRIEPIWQKPNFLLKNQFGYCQSQTVKYNMKL